MSERLDQKIGHYVISTIAASGATYRYIPVGNGLFKANLSLYTNDANASPYYLAFRFKDSKGVYNEVVIDSGNVDLRAMAHVQNVEFEGPGDFLAYLLPATSPSTMTLAAYIRRVNP